MLFYRLLYGYIPSVPEREEREEADHCWEMYVST